MADLVSSGISRRHKPPAESRPVRTITFISLKVWCQRRILQDREETESIQKNVQLGRKHGTTDIPYQEIVDYWKVREDECGFGVDWSEAHERCWRCGYKSRLHRCHIVPRSQGGPYDPSNLVLLCGRCHREGPNINDPRFMWLWLRTTCVPFYDLYWTARGVHEFEKMFGRKPFSSPDFNSQNLKKAKRLMRIEMRKTTIHFGEGRLNPSTIACIFALIEEKLIGHPPTKSSFSFESRIFFESAGMAGQRVIEQKVIPNETICAHSRGLIFRGWLLLYLMRFPYVLSKGFPERWLDVFRKTLAAERALLLSQAGKQISWKFGTRHSL